MPEVENFPQYRRGTFALMDQIVHEASYRGGSEIVVLHSDHRENPDRSLYQWNQRYSQWRAEVPVDSCQRIYSVHSYAKYREHGVLVEKVNNFGMAMVLYAEWDGAWATENGFLLQNSYEYYKTVPFKDLTDHYEKHDDLLFSRWRTQNFSHLAPGEANEDSLKAGNRPRKGQLATVRGIEYSVLGKALGDRVTLGAALPKNPDPEIFTWNEQRTLWVATIAVQQCERLVEVTTRAEYVGYPCEISTIFPDGSAELYYLGADKAKAKIDGFVDTGQGKWINTVDIFDLTRYHEHHRELPLETWHSSR